MALMVGDRGSVVGIEHIRDLVEVSIRNVRKNHLALLQSGRITFVVGDGRKGMLHRHVYYISVVCYNVVKVCYIG